MVDIPTLIAAASELKAAILDPDNLDRRRKATWWRVEGTTAEKNSLIKPGDLDPYMVIEGYGNQFLKVLYPSWPYRIQDVLPPLPEDLPQEIQALLDPLVQKLRNAWAYNLLVKPPLAQDETLERQGTRREILKMLEQVEALASTKGKPGRRGYPKNAKEYALKLRAENPLMKAHTIRLKCLKRFSADDLPPDGESFRAWLNRKPKNRTN